MAAFSLFGACQRCRFHLTLGLDVHLRDLAECFRSRESVGQGSLESCQKVKAYNTSFHLAHFHLLLEFLPLSSLLLSSTISLPSVSPSPSHTHMINIPTQAYRQGYTCNCFKTQSTKKQKVLQYSSCRNAYNDVLIDVRNMQPDTGLLHIYDINFLKSDNIDKFLLQSHVSHHERTFVRFRRP